MSSTIRLPPHHPSPRGREQTTRVAPLCPTSILGGLRTLIRPTENHGRRNDVPTTQDRPRSRHAAARHQRFLLARRRQAERRLGLLRRGRDRHRAQGPRHHAAFRLRRGRGADQQCRAEASRPRRARQRADLACAVLDAVRRRAGAICELGDLGDRHRDLGHQGQGAQRADLETARRRARQGAGLRHHRRARRRHRAIVRSRAAAGRDGLQVPEDAGRPPRPRQPARPEADDRDRAQRRAPDQGAARSARRRDRDRHRRAVPARPHPCDGAGAADRALSRRASSRSRWCRTTCC